jgi:hypothetical protein
MDLRALTRLVLKLAGVFLLGSMLMNMPAIIAAPDELKVMNYTYLALYLVAGLFLLWLPGVVVNHVIRIEGPELHGAVTASRLLRVGIILLGFYFSVSALASLAFNYAKFGLFWRLASPYTGASGPPMTPDDFAYIVSTVTQLLFAVLLWSGSRFVVQFVGAFGDER